MANRWFGNLTEEQIGDVVRISESDCEYINSQGEIFKLMPNGLFFKKKSILNKENGYIYTNITINGKLRSRRSHRLLAIAFIPNPLNLDVVGHRNNVKSDYSLGNLYWTSCKENTQKAVDEGLMQNAVGVRDSQSTSLVVTDNEGNVKGYYGSITVASKHIKNFSKSSIAKVVDKSTKGRKGLIFRSISKEDYYKSPTNLRNVKLETNYIKKVRTNIAIFYDSKEIVVDSQKAASKITGIEQRVISHLIKSGRMHPTGYYFERTNKCVTQV